MSFFSEEIPLTEEGMLEARTAEVFASMFLKFPGNDDGTYGNQFILDPWERDVWYPVFGTGRLDDAGNFIRQYNRGLVGVPRGVGKTVLAAAILLTEATIHPVMNGQYGLIADSTDNAQNAFRTLAALIKMSPELSAVWKVYKSEIRNIETGARIAVFPNKVSALQGWHFNVCICDEVHIYRDDQVWKAVISGQRNIRNALALAITTAGDERAGFLWEWIQDLKAGKDPECFYYWVGLDDDDDMNDRSTWEKVAVSKRITIAEMENQLHGLGKRDFERYQLNRFPFEKEAEPFMKRADVELCVGVDAGEFDPSEWFAVGLDGAVSGDTLAIVAVQQAPDGKWRTREWVWTEPTRDSVYDLMDVGDVVEALAYSDGRPLIVCDPARLQYLKNWLYNKKEIELFDFNQSPKQMCPASELLAANVGTHNISMDGTPKLAEHCINAVSEESKAYGRRLSSVRHGKNSRRIDAAVACAMAMSSYESNLSEHVGSYDILSIPI